MTPSRYKQNIRAAELVTPDLWPVCPRCHDYSSEGAERCETCDAPLVSGTRRRSSRAPVELPKRLRGRCYYCGAPTRAFACASCRTLTANDPNIELTTEPK